MSSLSYSNLSEEQRAGFWIFHFSWTPHRICARCFYAKERCACHDEGKGEK